MFLQKCSLRLLLIISIFWTGFSSAFATFDITQIATTGNTYDFSAQETSSRGFYLSPDGSKAYVLGYSSDSIHQYTLSTPNDLSTISYDNKSFSVASWELNLFDFTMSSDGLHIYLVEYGDKKVSQFDLSTAWDISTASYTGKDIVIGTGFSYSVDISPDGTRVIVSTEISTDYVFEYTLSTPFDFNTETLVAQHSFGDIGNIYGLRYSDDGNYMFLSVPGHNIRQYNLSTPFDVGTRSYFGAKSMPLYGAFDFSSDGTKMFFVRYAQDDIYEYTTSGTFDVGINILVSQYPPVFYPYGVDIRIWNISDLDTGLPLDGGLGFRITNTGGYLFQTSDIYDYVNNSTQSFYSNYYGSGVGLYTITPYFNYEGDSYILDDYSTDVTITEINDIVAPIYVNDDVSSFTGTGGVIIIDAEGGFFDSTCNVPINTSISLGIGPYDFLGFNIERIEVLGNFQCLFGLIVHFVSPLDSKTFLGLDGQSSYNPDFSSMELDESFNLDNTSLKFGDVILMFIFVGSIYKLIRIDIIPDISHETRTETISVRNGKEVQRVQSKSRTTREGNANLKIKK